MQSVIVVSKNPNKIEAARIGFTKMFPDIEFEFVGASASSDVPEQPMGDEETLRGAINRVKNIRALYETADYYVGIEGGIETRVEGMMVIDWLVIENRSGHRGQAKMNAFYLPPAMEKLIAEGVELGVATDQVFKTVNTKTQESGIGLLTDGNIPRTDYLIFAVTLALISFKNPELYLE